jgi:hypothetical protein
MAATTKNILTDEFLFRTGIFSDIAGNIIFLFLVLTFYRLLKQVNERQAKLMVMLVLVQIPISFVIELFSVTSFMILKGEILKTLVPAERQDMAGLFLICTTTG